MCKEYTVKLLETTQSFVAMNDLIVSGSETAVQAALSWLNTQTTWEVVNPHIVDVTSETAIVTYDSLYVPTYIQKLEQECFVLADLIGVSELSDAIITYKRGEMCVTSLSQYLDSLVAGGEDTLGLYRIYAPLNKD